MDMIDIFFKKYKLDDNIKIKFINKQGSTEERTFKMKQIRIYSANCFYVPLVTDKNTFYELFIDKDKNFVNLRTRIGNIINTISKKILEIDYCGST